MEEINIIIGCLSENDIPKDIKGKEIIVIEAFYNNYKKFKNYKCYNYFVSNKTEKIKLYYSSTVDPDLRLLKKDKDSIIKDIWAHHELRLGMKLKHIKSIESKIFQTITLKDFFQKNDIDKITKINMYLSVDVIPENVIDNKILKEYNILNVYYSNKLIYHRS